MYACTFYTYITHYYNIWHLYTTANNRWMIWRLLNLLCTRDSFCWYCLCSHFIHFLSHIRNQVDVEWMLRNRYIIITMLKPNLCIRTTYICECIGKCSSFLNPFFGLVLTSSSKWNSYYSKVKLSLNHFFLKFPIYIYILPTT